MPQVGSDIPVRVLLDTNIVIALFANDTSVLSALRSATEVCVPVVVLGELYYGARKSARSAENALRIADLAAATTIIQCDAETAIAYGETKMSLQALGMPIPENDVWIAAIAQQHALTLATRDAHFDAVPGLSIARW